MKTQRIRWPDSNQVSWIVLDDDYHPIRPIQKYIRYLGSLERSPNTIHAYANHLKLYWEFLKDSKLEWKQVSLENLADFITWLRRPEPKVVSIREQESKRAERTINTILSVVCGFYQYQERIGATEGVDAYRYQFQLGRKYKPFLHHITKGKETRTRLLKLKETKRVPKTLTQEQVKRLIGACNHLRDKFLVCLLYETGLRIGQALGLRHEDVRSWDNEIQMVPREDNANGARAKSLHSYKVHVSKELMRLYSQYLMNEYPDIDSDYVFVNIWDGCIGHPVTYSTVTSLFRRISKKSSIKATPHTLRHTHATELIRSGWDMSYVQKRLGHISIQTTINTYVHLQDEDMKEAYQKYLIKRDG